MTTSTASRKRWWDLRRTRTLWLVSRITCPGIISPRSALDLAQDLHPHSSCPQSTMATLCDVCPEEEPHNSIIFATSMPSITSPNCARSHGVCERATGVRLCGHAGTDGGGEWNEMIASSALEENSPPRAYHPATVQALCRGRTGSSWYSARNWPSRVRPPWSGAIESSRLQTFHLCKQQTHERSSAEVAHCDGHELRAATHAIYRVAACAVPDGKVSTLCHELWNHAMEQRVLVVQRSSIPAGPFLTSAECPKILGSSRHHV